MSEDNVIQFPQTSAGGSGPGQQDLPLAGQPPVPGPEIQQQAAQGQQMILGIIDKNRRQGLEALKKRVESLTANDKLASEAIVESRLRDLEHGLGASATVIDAVNNLLEYIKHDLIACIKNIERTQVQQFQAAAHLQTLIQLLVEKDLVTHEEMEGVWNKIIPGQIAQAKAESTDSPEEKPEG